MSIDRLRSNPFSANTDWIRQAKERSYPWTNNPTIWQLRWPLGESLKMKRIGVKSPTVADGIDSIQTVESAYVTAENHQLQETSMWIIHEYFKSIYVFEKKIASCFWKSPETIGRNPESAHVLKFETQDSKTSHQKMELRHFVETPFCNIQSEFSSIVHSILWSDLFVPVFLKNVPVC